MGSFEEFVMIDAMLKASVYLNSYDLKSLSSVSKALFEGTHHARHLKAIRLHVCRPTRNMNGPVEGYVIGKKHCHPVKRLYRFNNNDPENINHLLKLKSYANGFMYFVDRDDSLKITMKSTKKRISLPKDRFEKIKYRPVTAQFKELYARVNWKHYWDVVRYKNLLPFLVHGNKDDWPLEFNK